MDRIQLQASKLWDLLFDDETAETYQKTLNLTGTILKELAQLIWLILISVFVFGAWFSDTSVKAGKSIRDWLDNKGSDTATAEGKPIGETSKDLLEKGRASVNQLLNQAREQLGLEPQETIVKPAATPAQKPAPQAAQKPPVSAQPSAAAANPSATTPAKKSSAGSIPSDSFKSSASSSPSETSREEDDSDWPPKTAD